MKTPILFIIFNRPDVTAKSFAAIRKIRPTKLYIAADGPRLEKANDPALIKETRAIVEKIDWDCDVKRYYQDKNLGCKLGVSGAITWFFSHEPEGIIIEDDLIPDPSFFPYCEKMLERYRHDTRIMMITGTNYLSDMNTSSPYFFSEHFTIWGWATWARAWQHYDVTMEQWNDSKIREFIQYKFQKSYIAEHFNSTFKLIEDGMDTWDIQWVLACFLASGLCITPTVNLITNIGLEGTHSNSETDSHNLPRYSLDLSQLDNAVSTVHLNSTYDNELHRLKSKPAIRRRKLIGYLKKFGLYNLLKVFYRTIRKVG